MNLGKTVFDDLGEDKFFPKKQAVEESLVETPVVVEQTVAQTPQPIVETPRPEYTSETFTMKEFIKRLIAQNVEGDLQFSFKYSKGYLLKFGELINANNLESVLSTAMSTGASADYFGDLKHYVSTLNYLMRLIGMDPYNPELFSSNSAKALGKFMAILHDAGRDSSTSAQTLYLGSRLFPTEGSIDEIYKKMVLHVRAQVNIEPVCNTGIINENPLETL